MAKGWMLFDTISGNAVDIIIDPYVAEQWSKTLASESDLVLIEFTYDFDFTRNETTENNFDNEGGAFVPED